MLSLRALAIAFTTLWLTACARSPVVHLYDGPERSDSQVVTVRVPSELQVHAINGKQVDGVNTFFATDHKDLKLSPGRYEILAYYKELWQLNVDDHDIIKSDPATFTVDGNAGERYRLAYDKPDDVEQARALEDNFSGWVENTRTGDTTPTTDPGLSLKRGLLAPIAGAKLENETTDTVTPQTQPEDSDGQESGDRQADTTTANTAAAQARSEPGYLDTLKAQWKLATPQERRQFLQWIAE